MNQAQQTGHPGYHREPIQYFLPSQVVLHLEHTPGLTPGELSAGLRQFFADKNPDQPWKQRLLPPEPEAVITFPFGRDDLVSSLAPVRTVGDVASQDDLATLLVSIYQQLRQPITIVAGSGVTIRLKSVAPNWLTGSARHGGGISGPGGWPKQAAAAPGAWPMFHFPDIPAMDPPDAPRGAGVHVAILDTAPSLHDLIEAYDHWIEDHPGQHPLAESLLAPGGPLRVYPASLQDLLLTADYSAAGHRYRMTDHGLFIAGIVHTIARQAALHLYEVLDPYGIGCLETIARGLLKVLNLLGDLRRSGSPFRLVVNCSLMLGVSADGKLDPDLPAQLRDPNLLEHMRIAFEQIIALLDQPDVVVVASAGNDARPDDCDPSHIIRPPARFPAAFDSVIGVGATPKGQPMLPETPGRFKTSSYSNLADNPRLIGIATLGGEAGVEQGIQGIYIGDFPRNTGPFPEKDPRVDPADVRYDPNETGWAWWSGTSFAAPVISGLLAAWWGSDLNLTRSDAVAFLDASTSGRTADNERVVLAEQPA